LDPRAVLDGWRKDKSFDPAGSLTTAARTSSPYSCYYSDYTIAATKFHDGIKDFVCLDNNEPSQLDRRFTCEECVISIGFVDKIT
jgi:hypothetical protein